MTRRWWISVVPIGLLGLAAILHIHAGRIFREHPLSWSAPNLYGASAFASLCMLGYLVFCRNDLNRAKFCVFAISGLVLLVWGIIRALHILVVEWGSV
jgi:hypothetical protein